MNTARAEVEDGFTWPQTVLDKIALADGNDQPGLVAYPHFEGRALGTLAWPFRNKGALTGFIQAFTAEATELDGVAWDIVNARWVDTAIGDQILKLGKINLGPVQAQFDDDLNRAIVDAWGFRVQLNGSWEDREERVGQRSFWKAFFNEALYLEIPSAFAVHLMLDDAIPGLEDAIVNDKWPSALNDLFLASAAAGILTATLDWTLGTGAVFDQTGFDEGEFFAVTEITP